MQTAPTVPGVHCPDCLTVLDHRPRLRQDGRCRPCRRQLTTRDDRRRARAAKQQANTDKQLADAHV